MHLVVFSRKVPPGGKQKGAVKIIRACRRGGITDGSEKQPAFGLRRQLSDAGPQNPRLLKVKRNGGFRPDDQRSGSLCAAQGKLLVNPNRFGLEILIPFDGLLDVALNERYVHAPRISHALPDFANPHRAVGIYPRPDEKHGQRQRERFFRPFPKQRKKGNVQKDDQKGQAGHPCDVGHLNEQQIGKLGIPQVLPRKSREQTGFQMLQANP